MFADPVDTNLETASRADRLAFPDADAYTPRKWSYAGVQAVGNVGHLPHLRPRALFLYGTKGCVIAPERRTYITETTGVQTGGSGGARLGCVEAEEVKGTHFFPFENPEGTAKRLAVWIQKEKQIWKNEKAILDERFGSGRSAKERQQFPPDFDKIAEKWASCRPSKL